MESRVNKIRRTDRQETDGAFLQMLLTNSMSCSIAVETGDYPLIHVAFFTYDKENHQIIFHFSKHGFGGTQLVNGKKATVSLYKFGKLYTAEKAVDFGCEYQSLIIYGNIQIIEKEREKMDAMKEFFNKFFHHISPSEYNAFTVAETKPIHVAKIKIDKWFGKQHLVPEKAGASFYSPINPLI